MLSIKIAKEDLIGLNDDIKISIDDSIISTNVKLNHHSIVFKGVEDGWDSWGPIETHKVALLTKSVLPQNL